MIELLVVIAIIAILAAILFPVFMGANRAGKLSMCISNLRQIGYGVKLYQEDNAGYFPSCQPYPGIWGYPGWTRMLMGQYVRNKSVFLCPLARNWWEVNWSDAPQFSCKLNYSYNEYLYYRSSGYSGGSTIRQPSWVHLLSDGYRYSLAHDWNDDWDPNVDHLPSGMVRIKYADGRDKDGKLVIRHGGTTVLFTDLHVKFLDPASIKAFAYPGFALPDRCREWPVMYPGASKY